MEADSKSRFLRIGQVLQRGGISRSMLYALIAKGEFPRQVPLGARAVGWIESEVDAWIAERIEAARGPERWSVQARDQTKEAVTCA